MNSHNFRRLVLALLLVCFTAQTLPAARTISCGPLDVVFVIDTTASMGGALDNVKSELATIIRQINDLSGGDTRMGLVMFRNEVTVLNDLGPAPFDSLIQNVLALDIEGSIFEPEASDEAVRTVVHGLLSTDQPAGQQIGDFRGRFRANASKVLVLVTDARPAGHDGDFTAGVDDVNARVRAIEASDRNIRIASIFVPTPNSEGLQDVIVPIMQGYASITGGKYYLTNADGTGVAAGIQDAISLCGGSLFEINAFPKQVTVGNNQTVNVQISTEATGKFSGPITFSAINLPEGVSVSFSPTTIGAPGTGTTTMTITTGGFTLPTDYPIEIVGTSGSVARSTTITLDITCRPVFILALAENRPASQQVDRGKSATLRVIPSGSGPYQYQWFRGSSGNTYFPIEGANGPTLQTDAVERTGEYWVQITNACSSTDSETAVVSVRRPNP